MEEFLVCYQVHQVLGNMLAGNGINSEGDGIIRVGCESKRLSIKKKKKIISISSFDKF